MKLFVLVKTAVDLRSLSALVVVWALMACACTQSRPVPLHTDLTEATRVSEGAFDESSGPEAQLSTTLEEWLERLPAEDSEEAVTCVDDPQPTGVPVGVAGEGSGCGCQVTSLDPCGEDFVCVFNGWSVSGCDEEYLCRIACQSSKDCPENWGCLALGEDIVIESGVYKHCVPYSPLTPLICELEGTFEGIHVKLVDEQLLQFVAVRSGEEIIDAVVGDCWSWEEHEAIATGGVWPETAAQFKLEWTIPWEKLPDKARQAAECIAMTVLDCEGNWYTCRTVAPQE